jgi:hypothetical protein
LSSKAENRVCGDLIKLNWHRILTNKTVGWFTVGVQLVTGWGHSLFIRCWGLITELNSIDWDRDLKLRNLHKDVNMGLS